MRSVCPTLDLGSLPYGAFGLSLSADTRVENEPVGGRHVLVVSQVEQVMDCRSVVSRGQEREDERSRPAAGWFLPWSWPVFVLAQVRAGHGSIAGRIQAGVACVAI